MYERILEHLKKHGSITSLEAIRKYGCTRLSQYIYLLRNDGYKIVNEIVKDKNRYNDPVHYVKYRLVQHGE